MEVITNTVAYICLEARNYINAVLTKLQIVALGRETGYNNCVPPCVVVVQIKYKLNLICKYFS